MAEHYRWTPEKVALLGTLPDAALAEALGCSAFSVWNARTRYGIPPFKPVFWTEEVLQQLGVMPDWQVAEIAGKTVAAVAAARRRRGISLVRMPRWLDGHLAELGTKPDSQIAKELGVGLSTVAKQRKKHGIVASTKRRPWQREELALLGKYSDAEVGRMTGRTKDSTKMERLNRRIPGIDPAEATRLFQQVHGKAAKG